MSRICRLATDLRTPCARVCRSQIQRRTFGGLCSAAFIGQSSIHQSPRRTFSTTLPRLKVLRSTFPDVELPEIPIYDYCFQNSESYGDRQALINGDTGYSMSYNQVKDAVWRVSSGLARLGCRQGSTLMIVASNSIEYIIMFHATIALGASCTLANPAYPVADIARQMNDSHPEIVFFDEGASRMVKEAILLTEKTNKKLVVNGTSDGCIPYSTLLADDGTARPLTIELDAKDTVAILPYSSGTTGFPKGVMLTHHNMTSNVQQVTLPGEDPFWSGTREASRTLAFLPFYHMFAVAVNFVVGFRWGQTAVVQNGFNPRQFLKCIHDYELEMTFIVPPLIHFLNKDPLVDEFDLGSLRRLLCAAAPLDAETAHALKEKLPNVTLGQGYGMSESSPFVTLNPLSTCEEKPGSVGILVPNTEIKLVNTETGAECEVGERGEVWIRGVQIMAGYLNNPTATHAAIDNNNWFHSGDIGYFDEEDHLYIVDRLKELIKYKAFQVPPAELEALLVAHPAVAEAGVTGVPDELAGELPRAYVSLRPGYTATEAELIQFVADNTVAYKKLRGGLEFLPEIPKTASGKILRRVLKQMAIDTLKQN